MIVVRSGRSSPGGRRLGVVVGRTCQQNQPRHEIDKRPEEPGRVCRFWVFGDEPVGVGECTTGSVTAVTTDEDGHKLHPGRPEHVFVPSFVECEDEEGVNADLFLHRFQVAV